SVIGEEWGFVGSILVLLLFAILMLRLVRLAREIEHPFGSIVAAGAAGIFLIHISVNIGMVLGLLPVIGIPLPFLSYGGSALLTNTTLMGLALAAYMRRSEFAMYI
ncbi:MAG: rod shape-determining protein RodA, partial [Rhodothermaceae bacterium]|nr:rod shape-determining protein RodA [Rhodothermaceae bacterium]